MAGMEVNRVEAAQAQPLAAGLNPEDKAVKNGSILECTNNDHGQGPNTTPPTSAKYNYKNFPSGQRDVAASIVSNTVSTVDREVRHQTQENPYVVDYNTFPNPADYNMPGMSKSEQFDAWKDDVNNWKNRQLDEIEKRNHATVDNLNKNVNQLRETVINGFLQTYAMLEYSQEELMDMYDALGGNLDSMKEELNTQLQECKQGIDKATREANYAARVAKQQGQQTRDEIRQEAGQLHKHISADGGETRDTVKRDGSHTRGVVFNEGQRTRDKMDNMNARQEKIANLRKEINIAIRNDLSSSKVVIRRVLMKEGYRMDITGGEEQLSNIINNITDEGVLSKIRAGLGYEIKR